MVLLRLTKLPRAEGFSTPLIVSFEMKLKNLSSLGLNWLRFLAILVLTKTYMPNSLVESPVPLINPA